eukprot:132212_1
MSSLKRELNKIETTENKDDHEHPPPKKRIKLHQNIKQQYQDAKYKIIEESENKINILQQQIEQEKERKQKELKIIDNEYSDFLSSITQNTPRIADKLDMYLFTIVFTSEQSLSNDETEYDFATKWSVKLIIKEENMFDCCGMGDKDMYSVQNQTLLTKAFPNADIQSAQEFVIGTASFFVVQMRRLYNFGWMDELFTVLDAQYSELADLMTALDMSNSGTFLSKESVSMDKMNEGGEHCNIILINRVEINKHFKGKKYGKYLVQRICDNFGTHMCRVVLKPFPLQWERKDPKTEEDNINFEKDRKKVIGVWESIGFEQISDTKYWGRSQALNHPMERVERYKNN